MEGGPCTQLGVNLAIFYLTTQNGGLMITHPAHVVKSCQANLSTQVDKLAETSVLSGHTLTKTARCAILLCFVSNGEIAPSKYADSPPHREGRTARKPLAIELRPVRRSSRVSTLERLQALPLVLDFGHLAPTHLLFVGDLRYLAIFTPTTTRQNPQPQAEIRCDTEKEGNMADTTFDATIISAVRKAKRGRSSRPRRNSEDFGGGKPLPRGTVHVLRYDSDGSRESFVALPGDHRRDVCA